MEKVHRQASHKVSQEFHKALERNRKMVAPSSHMMMSVSSSEEEGKAIEIRVQEKEDVADERTQEENMARQ